MTHQFGTWYPIESAPNDSGDYCQLWTTTGWVPRARFLFGGWREWCPGWMLISGSPLYWMPLPPPPASVEKEEGR